jgi:putative DNA primase/helicase
MSAEGSCSCGKQENCSSPGKHPRTSAGLKDGTINPEQIESWWERSPQANIGIVTGGASGIVVLDIDVDKDGEESLKKLEAEYGDLPTTTIAMTGSGGMHYLFRHPGVEIRNSAGKLGRGLDVRGDGGYVVAAPSNHVSGGSYEWLFSPEEQEPAAIPGWLLNLLRADPRPTESTAPRTSPLGDEIPEGQRNERLTSLAGALRVQGLEEVELRAALLEVNEQRCTPPLPEAEVEAIARSIASYPTGHKRQKLTDYGNAERLVARHGQDLRFSPGLGWLVWDGARWQRDADGEALRRMKETIRAEWAKVAHISDRDERNAMVSHLNRSESARGLKAGLEVAQSERPLVVGPDQLDRDPWLLAVENGTLDLETGKLRPPQRDDLITRTATAAFVADARSDLWERFLETVTGGDQELKSFLQRAVGYSLTGFTSEEVLFFCHGPAASGKSTFLEAIKGVAGEHALTTDFETLLKRSGGSGVRNDIARLAGARIVVGVEVDEGRALADGLIKQLTGGDRITARLLYKEYFEFTPRFTLWLAANDRPYVRESDTGMWRRIVQMPFTEAIPEGQRDPALKHKLRDDPDVRSAILAWALEGSLAWQKEGLQVPDRVRTYTEEYRAEVDPLTEFFEEYALFAANERVERARLLEAYRAWAHRAGEQAVGPKALASALKRRGVSDGGKSGVSRYWQGISLTEPAITAASTEEPF